LNFLQLIGALALCQAVGILGAFFTVKAISTWYRTLKKPSFNPPNWIFGPVWTLLYALLGIVLYRLWQLDSSNAGRSLALALFWIQLSLNAIWTPIFFGLRALWPAFIEILFMLAAILATTVALIQVDNFSAWLMVPYVACVSFAALLNYQLAKLNS
jgi:tryptophan-rich sensory protein